MDNAPDTTPVIPQDGCSQCNCIHAQGFVEVINPDGSKSQVKKEVAQKMVENLENLKSQLGGAK